MDICVLIIIYLLVLGVLLRFAFIIPQSSDRQHEYHLYRALLFKGEYRRKGYGVLGSALTVIILPYLVHKLLRINHLLAFKITPCFFYALMPVFVYLISRQYLNIGYSVIASMVLFSNFFFLYFPNMGRNSIAFGFLAGMFWALLSGYTVVASVFAILVVLSHYGTTYLTLYVLGITAIVMAIIGNIESSLIITLVAMGITATIWHTLIASDTGKVCINFMINTITFSDRRIFRMPTGYTDSGKPEVAGGIYDIFNLETKEQAVQAAFGKGMLHASIPKKIEFVTSWLIVIAVTGGLVIAFVESVFPVMFIVMAVALYSTILATILSPRLSRSYGVIRVYLTAMILLAPCFVISMVEFSKLLGINGYIIPSVLVLIHALCVSGIMHSFFGITKHGRFDAPGHITKRVYYDGGPPE